MGADPVSLRIALTDYGITSASGVITDILDSEILRLSRAENAERFFLELRFPCKIDDDTVSAKFKSKTGILVVSALPAHGPATLLPKTCHAAMQASCSTHSTSAQADGMRQATPPLSNHDDVSLMRDFGDEAYIASLTLESRPPAQPADASGSDAALKEHHHTAVASASQGIQSQAACSGSSTPSAGPEGSSAESSTPAAKTSHLALAPGSISATEPSREADSRGSQLTSTAPPPAGLAEHNSQEAPVDAAVGVDGSSLAALLGFSFAHMPKPGPISAPKGNAKKAKKAEKRKALTASSTNLEAILKQLAHSLLTRGWAVCDNFFTESVTDQARQELKQMEKHYIPGEIWVGKEADAGAQIALNDVRGDSVLWLDEQALTATAFIKEGKKEACSFQTLHRVVAAVDQLVMHALPAYVADLANVAAGGRSDAMLAVYPGRGSRFAKHIDNSANDGRRLTCLCYLNKGWVASMGGCLRLFSPGQEPVDVLPLGGRVAMFWSKTVAHEVRPTHEPRHSFTLWYYDALEKAEAMATARVGAGGATSAAAQSSARALIRDILAQDVIKPTEEGCAILARRIRAMTTTALTIVAGVVGASSVQDFVTAASSMSSDGLAMLRDEIGRMGLQQTHAPTI